MLKQILFISAAALAVPALAQTAPPAPDPMAQPEAATTTPPVATPDTPASTMTMPEHDSMTAPPVDPAEPMQPAPTPDAAAPKGAVATPAQIVQLVDKDFPTYDKDVTSDLNQAEFATWMKSLRKLTEPALDTESAEVAKWISNAFAAADKDSSKTVTKVELASFLTQGAAPA